jgi:hypothetical protein
MRLRQHLTARLPLAALLLLAACATPPRVAPSPEPPERERCASALAAFDRAVALAEVGDAEAARIPGHPWLRTNRFLASYRDAPLSGPALAAWVAAMRERADDARRVEYANLPAAARQTLDRDPAAPEAAAAPLAMLEACARASQEATLASSVAVARLRDAARAPDAYDDALRALGVYPLTALVASVGIRGYEQATLAAFAAPLDALPVRGSLVWYAPAARTPSPPADIAALLERARRNADALGIPRFDDDDARRLLAAYAPAFVVDEAGADDRIGAPALDADATPRIVTDAPAVYTRIAYARSGDAVLVQLVYTAWFPARTAQSPLDPLAGPLDGIVWRVTLAPSGAPLLFDSIHPCGCYQLFFPTARLAVRPQAPSIDEQALVPQTLPALAAGAPVALRLEAGTHYLRRVIVDAAPPAGARGYALRPEAVLRTLPLPGGGTRSLYGEDGLVRASERTERFVFWPLGIPSAGAMRQWGHHATAFVGRRHFDEPFLLDRYFVVEGD